MSQVRKANPEKNCFLQADKLYIDSKIYVYNEVLGQVVEHSESVRSYITTYLLSLLPNVPPSGMAT